MTKFSDKDGLTSAIFLEGNLQHVTEPQQNHAGQSILLKASIAFQPEISTFALKEVKHVQDGLSDVQKSPPAMP